MRVPTIALTVATTILPTPSPLADRHTTDVVDAHADVGQWLSPIVDVGVASEYPKSSPETVTLHPSVEAALSSLRKLTTGAASGELATFA